MRKNYFVELLFIVVFIMHVSCREKHVHSATLSRHENTDSVFVAVAKPVNSQVLASISTIKPETGTKIFSVKVSGRVAFDTRHQAVLASKLNGRIERLNIKYNYQRVKKGQVIMEIYSPELAAAQREFIYIVNTADEVMINKSRQRLMLLGMTESEIKDIIYEKEVLYRVPVYSNADGYIVEKSTSESPSNTLSTVSAGNDPMTQMNADATSKVSPGSQSMLTSSPVLLREGQYVSAGQSLFTIYQSEEMVAEFYLDPSVSSGVERGHKVLINTEADIHKAMPASIGLIEPVYRNGQNFSIARIYTGNRLLQAGQLLTATIPLVYRGGWWLPKKAVWQTGSRNIVFRKEGAAFKPVEIRVKASIDEMIQVDTNIAEWEIASNAYYLVDSEGFVNTKTNTLQ